MVNMQQLCKIDVTTQRVIRGDILRLLCINGEMVLTVSTSIYTPDNEVSRTIKDWKY
jgi:hypothetical protein